MSSESYLFARILRNFTIRGNLLFNDLFLRILLHLAIFILIGPGNVIVIAGPTVQWATSGMDLTIWFSRFVKLFPKSVAAM